MEQFILKLRNNKHHTTLPRRHLFALLKDAGIPMSATEITYELRTVDRSTVYRTLDLLLELGIVKEVWPGGNHKYELSDEFQEHHHHVVCEVCGLISTINSRDLEKLLAKVAKKAGYQLTEHQVELTGLCSSHKKIVRDSH